MIDNTFTTPQLEEELVKVAEFLGFTPEQPRVYVHSDPDDPWMWSWQVFQRNAAGEIRRIGAKWKHGGAATIIHFRQHTAWVLCNHLIE